MKFFMRKPPFWFKTVEENWDKTDYYVSNCSLGQHFNNKKEAVAHAKSYNKKEGKRQKQLKATRIF